MGIEPDKNREIGEKVVADLQKDFRVVGSRRVHSWYTWAVVGIVIGIIAGVVYVANRSGKFDDTQAAILKTQTVVSRFTAPGDPSVLATVIADPGNFFNGAKTFFMQTVTPPETWSKDQRYGMGYNLGHPEGTKGRAMVDGTSYSFTQDFTLEPGTAPHISGALFHFWTDSEITVALNNSPATAPVQGRVTGVPVKVDIASLTKYLNDGKNTIKITVVRKAPKPVPPNTRANAISFKLEFQSCGICVNPGFPVAPKSEPIANRAPELSSIPDQTVKVGQTLTFQVVATDADGDKLQYSLGSDAQSGMAMFPNTGIFSWKPTAAYAGKKLALKVMVSDGKVSAPAQTMNITVTP